jgi:predicted DNA-binding transcriptional regulator AlpA
MSHGGKPADVIARRPPESPRPNPAQEIIDQATSEACEPRPGLQGDLVGRGPWGTHPPAHGPPQKLVEPAAPELSQDRRYLTQAHLSKLLNLSPRTLERMRAEGTGPRFIKAGRRVLYQWEHVEAWLARRSFISTAEVKEDGIR